MSGKLYFMMGCQRSGKSTYCNKWASEAPNRVVVRADDIRLALHGKRYIKYAETMVFAIKHVMIRAHLMQGCDVMVDGTHSSGISIQRILEIDPEAIAVRIDTPIDICIERAIATDQSDLIEPIKRVGARLKKIDEFGLQNYLAEILENIEHRGLYNVSK